MKEYAKIILAGGSGQMGSVLRDHFRDKADRVIILSRSAANKNGNIETLEWDGKNTGPWAEEINGADIIINLAGKNVNCRYNEKNKKEIFDSRTDSVEALAKAVGNCRVKPKLWIQAASATIYRHADDRPMTEEQGEIGNGFSVEVCKKWEKTFFGNTAPFTGMRKVVLRTSLVLGKNAGVFPRLENLVRFGLGGKQGGGKQWMSWIHEKDVAGIVEWVVKHNDLEGIINCTAPSPVKNKDFMETFRRIYGIPIGLPAPSWLLGIGAVLIGTETELILKSRWVLPEKLNRSGYVFLFPEIKEALTDIIRK